MTPSNSMEVFDRRLMRRHRDRAAQRFGEYDFLVNEVAERLLDRLDDMNRKFPLALDLGCHAGNLAGRLQGRGGIQRLIQCDVSERFARLIAESMQGPEKDFSETVLCADEEALPFAEKTFDLVMSNFSLHWVNDLPGALVQIRRILKPDGLFLAAFPGGETLKELRAALLAAESEVLGGASPRVSPFADVKDAGDLLQRAGFALPVADSDVICVQYENPMKLMADLKGMGENNAVKNRHPGFTPKSLFIRAAELYMEKASGEDGRVPATFEIVYLTAWAPDPSQQKPLKPGSAETRLADVLNARERGNKDGI